MKGHNNIFACDLILEKKNFITYKISHFYVFLKSRRGFSKCFNFFSEKNQQKTSIQQCSCQFRPMLHVHSFCEIVFRFGHHSPQNHLVQVVFRQLGLWEYISMFVLFVLFRLIWRWNVDSGHRSDDVQVKYHTR